MQYSKKLIFSGHKSIRNRPVNFNDEDFIYFNREFEKKIDDTHIYELQNVYLTSDGVVFKKFKTFKPSLHQPIHHRWLNFFYIVFIRLFKKKKTFNGTYFLGYNYYGKGYYHWLLEEFPRIYLSKKIEEPHTVLIPQQWTGFYSFRSMIKSFFKEITIEKKNSYYNQSIKLLDLKKTVIFPKNSYILVNKLLLPSYTAPTGNYNDNLIKELNKLLYAKSLNIEVEKYDKIYISRKKAARRKILNEQEVEIILKEYGFKCLCFEDFSFIEQAGLNAYCKVLISLHGAGLSNILFMKDGNSVVELRAKGDESNLCYFSLASALSLKYYYLFCEKDNYNSIVQDANVFVNLLELKKVLNLLA